VKRKGYCDNRWNRIFWSPFYRLCICAFSAQKSNHLFFNGQIFDAYSKIHKIFNKAKCMLMIIDAYADNTILDIVKRLKR